MAYNFDLIASSIPLPRQNRHVPIVGITKHAGACNVTSDGRIAVASSSGPPTAVAPGRPAAAKLLGGLSVALLDGRQDLRNVAHGGEVRGRAVDLDRKSVV